jgi:hypothetical protein
MILETTRRIIRDSVRAVTVKTHTQAAQPESNAVTEVIAVDQAESLSSTESTTSHTE